MSALTICDLSFIEELDTCESKIAGAASASASAAAGSTTNGTLNALPQGGYYSIVDPFSGCTLFVQNSLESLISADLSNLATHPTN